MNRLPENRRLMMIGYGAMGQEVHRLLPGGLTLDWLVVPEGRVPSASVRTSDNPVLCHQVSACSERPDLVVECGGQGAVRQHAEDVLRAGLDLAIISVGALADAALQQRLEQAARESGSRMILLSGAIAGADGLAAAREGGLTDVTYESIKAPRSWKGSPAEELIDLDRVDRTTVFFEGTARDAALQFPANANVAATVGLAGTGLDHTRVRLIVDPATRANTHRIAVQGRFGAFNIELNGQPLESNPKTSTLAALSVVRACRQLVDPVVI